jgi:hypothetical protein
MVMNSYVREDHLRGVTVCAQKLADQVGLKGLLEDGTGLSFSTYLSNRKSAYQLKLAVKNWIKEKCQSCLDAFPYKEAGLTREQVLDDATVHVFWSLVCQEYGKSRAIAIRNRILQDFSIREEFFAEGDAASSRDFSYLLDIL